MSTFGLPGCSGLQTSGGGGAGIANQYANLAALYAGKGALSNGDQWELLDTGRTGIKSTTLGIDDLFPHPLEQGMYPLNSSTMSFGALADGKINKAAGGTYATLESTCLKMALNTGDPETIDLFLPGLVARPGILSARFKLVIGTTAANQNFVFYWTRSGTITPAPYDFHAGYLHGDALGQHDVWGLILDDGAGGGTSTGEKITIENVAAHIAVTSIEEGSTGAYYAVHAGCGLDGANITAKSNELFANNGMDLTSATEKFYAGLRMTSSSPQDWYAEIYEVGYSRQWDGPAE